MQRARAAPRPPSRSRRRSRTPLSIAYSAAGSIDARQPLDHRFGEQVLRARRSRARPARAPAAPAPGIELRAFAAPPRSRCCLQLVVVLEVRLFLALLHLVQRRLRDVDVPALDQLGHLPVEEREQQRADVRAVDVRVGHDDDAVIAQLVGVVLVLVLPLSPSSCRCRCRAP